jgi:hypothetical protein
MRAESFARRAHACDGTNLNSTVRRAQITARRIAEAVEAAIGGKTYSCPPNYCTTKPLIQSKRALAGLAFDLFRDAKDIKLASGLACNVKPPPQGHHDDRKRSEDYYNDLLRAINGLPANVTRCP